MVTGYQADSSNVLQSQELYIDPKIIILDESTNALDNDSESLLMKNLFKWGEKKSYL